jgi:hypothetical protein
MGCLESSSIVEMPRVLPSSERFHGTITSAVGRFLVAENRHPSAFAPGVEISFGSSSVFVFGA